MLWKASFIIKNYAFEKPLSIKYKPPFTSEIMYEVLPNDKTTTLSITFDTDQISKPDILQRRRAKMLFSFFREISSPFIKENFDAELIELTPVCEEDKKEYNNMKSPNEWHFNPKPKLINKDVIQKMEKTFFKVNPTKLTSSGRASNYRRLMILRTMLHLYDRSLEYESLLDRFVLLWVTFNVIYDYLWGYNYPSKKLPHHSDRISDCIRNTLNDDDCRQILEPHKFFLAQQMPVYELTGTKEELSKLLKSKDIKKIEAHHQKSLAKEKKELGHNIRDYLINKYGLDFGKYWIVEDWVNMLVQVLLNIYGLRNLVFHSGAVPMERVEGIVDNPEGSHYWNIRNEILSEVDAILITKILNHF